MNDTKYDFNFLIDEPTSLATRLIREATSQAHEFRSDPKGYIKGSLANDAIGRKRGRLLLFGMAVGTVLMSSVLLMTVLFYYSQRRNSPTESARNSPMITPLFYPRDIRMEELKKGEDRAHGGGGAGNHESTPPSFGVRPPDFLTESMSAATT